MIKENEPFWFLVTHVEIEGQYLKIWAQTEERVIQSVNKLLMTLRDQFDYCQTNIVSPNSVMPHTQCCARGPNNEFSRAKILGFRSDGMVFVQFVDYGNVTHVPIHNIRLLDNLPGAEYLFSVPPSATPFILADVMPIGGAWMQEVVKQIRSFLVNNKFQGVYREINGCKIIKFNMMNDDFGTLLVNRNMALSSSSCVNNTQPTSPVQNLRMPHQVRHSTQENWRVPAVQQTLPQKVVKTNSFKAIQLEIGSVHDVQVSYVDEGPCKFSVQLLEAIPYLEAMMKSINSRPHIALQESPIAGTVCLGQQIHPQRLCRVVLNSPGDTSCKVYYADYGHHEILPFSSLYQIPDEFFVPNIFSIRFTLNGISNWTVSHEMKDYFGGLVANKNLKLRVCKGPLSPLTQYCDLYLNGKNVRDILSEVFPESCELFYPEPKQLQLGSKETVMVPFVESTAKFFVQIESDEKLLDDIMQQIEQASRTAATLSHAQMRKDMPCIALYEDKKWYRASILNIIDDTKVLVFYVDYGNEENVLVSNLRSIPSHLVNSLPKQAIQCCLKGFQFESANQELIKKFENLVLEERMILFAHDYVNGSYLVNLHDAKYISDPMADIGIKLRGMEPLQNQVYVRNQESFEKCPAQNQSSNWTGTGNWNKDKESGIIKKISSFDENSKSKFRKDNENEQRHDNRFRRENSDYQSGTSSNQFGKEDRKIDRFDQNDKYGKQQTDVSRFPGTKDYPSSDRFNRSNERNSYESNRIGKEIQNNRGNVNSRLDRNYGSDKDSDTSSKSGGKRNSRKEDQRIRDSPSNRNRVGRWENDHRSNDGPRNGYSNLKNCDKSKSPKDSRITKQEMVKMSEIKPAPKISSQIPPPNITVGAVKNCIMVYYNNPNSFYVQLYPDNKELNLVMEKIYSTYDKGGKIIPSLHIKEGLHCIAQWQNDEQWYRAVVKSVDALSTVTVFFIDYGNLETISFDKIKEIQPELVKLPAQAILCKMFCPGKSDWSKKESDQLASVIDDKLLEAEFIAMEQGVYQVILKDLKSNECLNDAFTNGIDLRKEKEFLRDKARNFARGGDYVSPEYASLSDKWLENKVEFGKTYSVSQAYFLNPQNVYLHLQNQQKEFRDMMNEMQLVYAKRQSISKPLEIGASVIAVLPEDGVLYRATVVELNKPRGPVVQYIDYGDRAMVDLRKIYPVEKKYMVLPKQALYCSLKNIAPILGSNWSNATEISKFFNAEIYDCIFHELQNDQYLISLNVNGVDISNALVQNGLAMFSSRASEARTVIQVEEVPKVDVNLLEGQTLHVKVSNVEGVNKFHVQFYTAKACQINVDSYMASKDPQMLKLPGQLAVMQNQAVECSLFDVPLSSKTDDMLKSLINGKDVKIFVEKVERNRLIVRLFDINGNKIKIVGSQNIERINPICNMPILSSTHDVIVTNIKNSSCVWLQRTTDAPMEKQLLDDMYDYYSKVKVQAMAIEKELFAGLWIDGNWYRMIVLEMRGSDEVKVQLIDYGDTGYILASDLRTLDDRFYLPHQLAVRVSLSVTLSGSNDSQIEVLEPMVKDKKLSATFYNVNRKWIVELNEAGEKLSDKLKILNLVKETTITPFEHIEASEMVVGERYKVIASHVDAPNSIWLQRKDAVEALYDLHDRMQEVAAACPNYEGIPEEKSLCLVMYSLDGCWYRAEVIDADAEITTVRFIDYGNTDVIDSSTGRVKQLPDKWKSIERYAIPCKLDVVPTGVADEWSEESCARIKHLTLADVSELTALIIGDKAPMRVDLFLGDKSICELLVVEGLAAYVKSSDELEEELEVVEEEPFDPRSAFVSHFVSVDEFWVQEDAKVKDLEMVADRLVMAKMFAPLQQVEEGLICIAHYPEDNQYYRAIVLSHDGKKTRVNYLDYGNSATTEDIRAIPQDLADIPPLSKKCCLAKPDGVKQWPDGVNAEFDNLAANGATVFILDVIATEGETFLVRMTHGSKDVAIELLELCAKPSYEDEGTIIHDVKDISIKERPTPIGEEITPNLCKISCMLLSPIQFWIQKRTDYLKINYVKKELADWEVLASAKDVNEVGKIFAVRDFENNPQCFRCKILTNTDAGLELLLIDLGVSISVHSDTMLRELPDDLKHIPALAVHCTLTMPEGLEKWPDSACEKFNDLTANNQTEFGFEILEPSGLEQPLPVVLYYKDQNVADLLLSSSNENFPNDKSNLIAGITTNKGMDHQNISSDSAVHSEKEQYFSEDTHAQENDVTENVKPETAIHLTIRENDSDKGEIPSQEDDLSYQEKIVLDELETTVVQEQHDDDEPKGLADLEEKIVPGSISRGLSVEEIARYSPVPLHSCPEEKIVPGSINKGYTFEDPGSVSFQEDKQFDTVVIAPDAKDFESKKLPQLVNDFQTICFDDKVVPSCISRGETPVEMYRPMTPKTEHSEKLVAGAVNAQSSLNFEDEDLFVGVMEENSDATV
ncbi:maternal protein tudor [Phymastichus coffea]|uniref:maternal protein tudor n=1 Tax=Phymastichus coffea TaxID=108790 RepID=UPI00273A93ED|nr:maternal protein tudor [Phymastichus coffea]